MLQFNFELCTSLVAMVTDAAMASSAYIWTELRHVLVGLTPTGVSRTFDKFLLLTKSRHLWWRVRSWE